uniref:Uncharacterized protein n=1 Tax=Anguilla anguilla TaxID=7936 RepID=A0A0E9V8H0_ANGAN
MKLCSGSTTMARGLARPCLTSALRRVPSELATEMVPNMLSVQ